MDLYFSPLSCSMATRIALYEAGAEASFVRVDPRSKKTVDGSDYLDVNPLGLVPTLRFDDGSLLSENAAILQSVGRRYPEAGMLPSEERQLSLLQQWLCFIGTELHKGLFNPLLDPQAPDAAKAYVRAKYLSRLEVPERALTEREYLLERFSVADAYLVTVLNWTSATTIDLKAWPSLYAYWKRLRQRPSVARAMAEEAPMYREESVRQT